MPSSGSMREIDELVSKRLQSSWGQAGAVTKLRPSNDDGELHKLVRQLDQVSETCSHERISLWESIYVRAKEYPKEVVWLDSRGRTCLNAVCAKRDVAPHVVQVMLEACRFGIEAQTDKTGHTALHLAILHQGSTEVVLLLMGRHRILEVADHRGNTALHLLCQNRHRHEEETKLLIDHLLEKTPHLVNRENGAGKSALHLAIENRRDALLINLLIDSCPSALQMDACGYTPLASAIQYGSELSVLERMCRVEPSVLNKKDDQGRFPLRWALECRVYDFERLRLLASSEAAVLDKDVMGRNALHLSLDRHQVQPQLVDLLMTVGPGAVNHVTKYGEYPLQTAFRRYAQARQALEHGSYAAATRQRDERMWWEVVCDMIRRTSPAPEQETLLSSALLNRSRPWLGVVQRLVGENPEMTRVRSPTVGLHPVMIVARWPEHAHKAEMVMSLLDAAPDMAKMPDRIGRSVLTWVLEQGNASTELIERLILASPESASQLDPTTRLYPALLAATKCGDDEVDADGSADKLSNTFILLQAIPDLMKQASEYQT